MEMKICRYVLIAIFILFSIASTQAPIQAQSIEFWSTEVESERMQTQRQIANRFTERTGISVSIIPVQQSRMSQKVIAAKAAGNLPDVIFVPASHANGWAGSGVLDSDAAKHVIETLDPETFQALNMLELSNGYAAVPSDGWAMLTLYRKELFQANGLNPPRKWDQLLNAARTFHDLPHRFGVLVPTHPTNAYTQQMLELTALSNGVELIRDGKIALDNKRMAQALRFYKKMAKFTPPGNYYWKQTRLFFMVGRTPQTFWSPFILDEMAGAREDIEVGVSDLPSKVGALTVLDGPHGEAGYISLNGFGITETAKTGAAKKFVKFMMSKGYADFLSLDPFGKMPLRTGTPEQPKKYVNEWRRASKYLERYPASVIERMIKGMDRGKRWGLAKGHGDLVSKIYGTSVLSEILVRDYLRGSLSASETARKMDRKLQTLMDK